MSPPTRGASVGVAAGSPPGGAGSPGSVVAFGSATRVVPTTEVALVTAETNENDPTLSSGSDQLSVHWPAGGIWVSATDTVFRSAPSCGAPSPTRFPSQARTRRIDVAASVAVIGSRNTIWICVGGTSTRWFAAGFDDTTSLLPVVPAAAASPGRSEIAEQTARPVAAHVRRSRDTMVRRNATQQGCGPPADPRTAAG